MVFADGNSATGTAAGSVTIVAPIALTKSSDLNFGTLVINPGTFTPGMLSIGPNGNIDGSALGGGTWLFTGSGHATPTAAQFGVNGQEGYPFGFATPPFVVALKDGSTMTITPNIAIVDGLTHGTVPSSVFVGGQLAIRNGKPGLWTGTFNAMVTYQ
jgi:hypothetical protein